MLTIPLNIYEWHLYNLKPTPDSLVNKLHCLTTKIKALTEIAMCDRMLMDETVPLQPSPGQLYSYSVL